MKVLYINYQGDRADYLRDVVMHGMRSLLGPDFVDVCKLDVMYDTFPADRSIYGRGFSLYRLLPDIPIDREDIPAKIKARYFDLIIYGSIHRCQDHLREVASLYQAPRVVLIDGEDHPGYLSGIGGLTFKRELYSPQPGCMPIHFGIPKEKILSSRPRKSRLMAPCDPLDKTTYIYTEESAYYAQYASAYYGATMRKAGFDCLRHYEIMAQWCIPYFRCLESLPALICHELPRQEMRLVQLAIEYYRDQDNIADISPSVLVALYCDLIETFVKSVRDHHTTEAVAKYIFDSIGVNKRCLVPTS